MSIPIAILTPKGSLAPSPWPAHSLEEVAHKEPPGFYTVGRTYHKHQAVMLDAHLDRLEESAHLEGMPLILDRQALRAALRHLIRQAAYHQARFRITIPKASPQRIQLALEPLPVIPPEMRARGICAATIAFTRGNPRAKTNYWLAARRQVQDQLPADVYEGLIVDERGRLLEGLSSNFYAMRDGALYTSNQNILLGTARRIVLDVGVAILPIRFRPIGLEEIPSLQEAFLSSSSRGVLPIVGIDDLQIGAGTPGAFTKRIHAAYADWVETHLEPI